MEDWNALAGLLLAALGDHVAERGRPTWVQVLDPPAGPGEVSLGLSDDDAGFMGWVAPPECQAVGVVATGRAWAIEPGGEPSPGVGTTSQPTEGVRLACVVTRDGTIGWHMVGPNGTIRPEAPRQGRLVDVLRRCFQLPTAAAEVGAGWLQAVVWVSSILEVAGRSSRPLTWREVACLHPLAQACISSGAPALGGRDVGCLAGTVGFAGVAGTVGLAGEAGEAWTWNFLRRHARFWAAGLISPEIADWMDDRMFSRWVLEELPGPEQLIGQVRPFLTPSAARRLAHAVRSAAGDGPSSR